MTPSSALIDAAVERCRHPETFCLAHLFPVGCYDRSARIGRIYLYQATVHRCLARLWMQLLFWTHIPSSEHPCLISFDPSVILQNLIELRKSVEATTVPPKLSSSKIDLAGVS
jgi:hypothetical protein